MDALETLAAAYATEHPVEIGRLLEASQTRERADFLAQLSDADAASVLSAMMPLPAAETLNELPADLAAAIMAQLDPRFAAALLGRLDPSVRAPVLEALPGTRKAQLEAILQYDPACAGSRVDPRAVAVPDSVRVGEAFEYLRRTPAGVLYYVYVVDEAQRLVGVFNLRELMLAAPQALVAEIMTQNPQRIRALDPFEAVVRHPAWRRVHALPVVDIADRFLGVLRYSVFRRVEAELGQSVSGPEAARTASALAELYSLGAGGFTHWISGLLSGQDGTNGGRP